MLSCLMGHSVICISVNLFFDSSTYYPAPVSVYVFQFISLNPYCFSLCHALTPSLSISLSSSFSHNPSPSHMHSLSIVISLPFSLYPSLSPPLPPSLSFPISLSHIRLIPPSLKAPGLAS